MCHINRDQLAPRHQPQRQVAPEQESFVRDMVSPECCFQPPAVRVFVGYLGLSPRELAVPPAANGVAPANGNGGANGDGNGGANGDGNGVAVGDGGGGANGDGNGNGDGANNDSLNRAGLPGEWVRLYRTLDFVDFIEVKWEDVIYHKKSTAAQLPIEGTILWVRSDAHIWHTRVQSRPMTASDFLRGPIAEQQLRSAQPTLMGGQVELFDTPSWGKPC